MTTIGKILVVLHLVLSITFMAFAGAVFTAQNNWKKAEQAALAKLATAEGTIKDKQTELDRGLAKWTQAEADLKNEIDRLKGLNSGLDVDVKTLTSFNNQLKKEVDQQRDQAALTTTEAIERKKESDLQREKNGQLYQSREEQEARLTEANDKVFALELQIQQMSEKYDQLIHDNKTMRAYLASKDLTTDAKQMVALTTPPPPLYGRILDVLKDARTRQEYIEISIGSDSGLVIGHKLTCYRGEKYLGEIRLTLVEADKSVGVVILPKSKNAEFRVGDEVTTKY